MQRIELTTRILALRERRFDLSRSVDVHLRSTAHTGEEVRAWVRARLLPSGGTTVAEVLGRIVGFVSVSRGPSHGWIDQMYVEPRFVGQRVGTALLAHALTEVPRPVRLHVFQANAGARHFYERQGFVPIAFTDGADNEERCPDVLYELPAAEGLTPSPRTP